MSTADRSRRRLREAVREEESAKAEHKFYRRVSFLGSLWAVGVVALWVQTIRWGIASIGVTDVGGTMMAAVFGLTVLTLLTIVGVGAAHLAALDARKDHAKAKWEYEDAILEDGGML